MGPKRGRKRRANDPDDAAARLGGDGPGRFRVSSCVREDHGQHLYCVAMNRVHPNHADVFATVGGKRASVYRLEPDGNMRLLQVYEDENDDESYFACAWCSSLRSDAALLAVATIRALSHASNARRAAQIANVYFAAFFAVLATSAVIAGAEPLASYQFVSGHAAYVRFQVLVALCYAPYLALTVGVAVADRWWPTTAGFVAAAAVGAHYYASAWHPAMLGAPPRARV